MAGYHLQNLCHTCSVALALCLLSVFTACSNSQNAHPSEHGQMFQKNPGEASPEMIAFFRQPKVELPEARNFSDPVWRVAAKVAPADPGHHSVRHARPTLLITGFVFAVLGFGLLATVIVAYMIHARRSRAWSSSTSLVGLAHWRNDPEIKLGMAV